MGFKTLFKLVRTSRHARSPWTLAGQACGWQGFFVRSVAKSVLGFEGVTIKEICKVSENAIAEPFKHGRSYLRSRTRAIARAFKSAQSQVDGLECSAD